MFYSKITATGRYLPRNTVSNQDLANQVETTEDWITSRTGIKERRIADQDSVVDMAVKAVNHMFQETEYDCQFIDLIVVATASADYHMPSTACMVQERIGANQAFCFDINAACSGFVYGLEVIDQYIKTGKVKRAILIGAEKLSRLVDWTDRATCVLFGDGAGCVLIESTIQEGGVLVSQSRAIGSQYPALTAATEYPKTPYYPKQKTEFLQMEGRAVFQFAVTKVSELLAEVQRLAAIESIDIYLLHQANKRIIESISRRLEQPLEKFYLNLERYGNTSAASIPIGLDELKRERKLEGKTVAIAGFGAGLTYGAAIIRF